jgi:uncharacterized membrane protein YfcA
MGVTTALAVLLAGALIGATGIGGVLVVPALTQLGGLDLPSSIAAAAIAFAMPGIAAIVWLWRSGAWSPRWFALLAGAVPAAAGGALVVHRVNAGWLFAGVAALALFSGVRGLLQARGETTAGPAARAEPGVPALLALGAVVGFGSALTGTGGPVLLVPALMLWRQPLARTVAAAQAIQLPVALCAGIGHAAAGAIDWRLALLLGVVLLGGSIGGQAAARSLPVRTLQAAVSALLVLVGAWFAWRAVQVLS